MLLRRGKPAAGDDAGSSKSRKPLMNLEFHRFFQYYNPYVNREWHDHYFAYDSLRQRYKVIKEKRDANRSNQRQIMRDIEVFESIYLNEIERVYRFIQSTIHDIDTDLIILVNSMERYDAKEKATSNDKSKSTLKSLREQHDRTIEVSLRSSYDKIKDVELFYHLNYYSICKISKKFEKLLQIYHVMVDEQAHVLNSQVLHSAETSQRRLSLSLPIALSGVGVVSISKSMLNVPKAEVITESGVGLSRRNNGSRVSLSSEHQFDGQFLVKPSMKSTSNKSSNLNLSSKVNAVESATATSDPMVSRTQVDTIDELRAYPVNGSVALESSAAKTDDHINPQYLLELNGEEESKKQHPPLVSELTASNLIEHNLHVHAEPPTPISPLDKPSPIELSNEKIALEKPVSTLPTASKKTVKTWEDSKSGQYFFTTFQSAIDDVEALKQRCIAIYSKKFRITYSRLASYELEFVKNKDKHYESTNFMLGIKIGIIVCLVGLFILDTRTIHNRFLFWKSPGLYVFTTIGNLLLYRVFWWVNISIWARFDINYISVLQLRDVKPNLLLVADQTTSLLALYFVDLLLFFRANTTYSSLDNSFLTYSTPIVLIGLAIVYQIYENVFLVGNERISRGLFDKQVLLNCFSAPFVKVTFRDVYSADVLTSFTRILADASSASCWIFSGTFLSREGFTKVGPENFCRSENMHTIASCVQMIPLFIRFLQCCRNMFDHKQWYPHAPNAVKYLLSLLVIISAIGAKPLFANESFTLFLIVVTAFYKWWWDVYMDWGLLTILPTSWRDLFSYCVPSFRSPGAVKRNIFLRESLMYPSVSLYYGCMILDLALRFLWVMSLVPQSALGSFVGYQLSLFVGTMELFRRCMWGAFRVEFEHLKMLQCKTSGFLPNSVLRRRSMKIASRISSSGNNNNQDSRGTGADSNIGSASDIGLESAKTAATFGNSSASTRIRTLMVKPRNKDFDDKRSDHSSDFGEDDEHLFANRRIKSEDNLRQGHENRLEMLLHPHGNADHPHEKDMSTGMDGSERSCRSACHHGHRGDEELHDLVDSEHVMRRLGSHHSVDAMGFLERLKNFNKAEGAAYHQSATSPRHRRLATDEPDHLQHAHGCVTHDVELSPQLHANNVNNNSDLELGSVMI